MIHRNKFRASLAASVAAVFRPELGFHKNSNPASMEPIASLAITLADLIIEKVNSNTEMNEPNKRKDNDRSKKR